MPVGIQRRVLFTLQPLNQPLPHLQRRSRVLPGNQLAIHHHMPRPRRSVAAEPRTSPLQRGLRVELHLTTAQLRFGLLFFLVADRTTSAAGQKLPSGWAAQTSLLDPPNADSQAWCMVAPRKTKLQKISCSTPGSLTSIGLPWPVYMR